MAAVQRRPEPRKFLDASLVPLQHALRARADVLADEAEHGAPPMTSQRLWLAAELRALAAELHHW